MPALEKYKQFKCVKNIPIPELLIHYQEWKHEPSGASILYLGCDDPENCFVLSFQTLPETSDGIAHILEHVVLCGSKKYPVRDPFFSMNRRSMNTFMNAMTGSDCTFYPAASQIEKDFYNLLSVYADSVFHPQLTELSFLQEGHRLEFENPYDTSTPLQIKGIVFNEMKGALSCPDSRLYEEMTKTLYPSVTYGVNSGGDPHEIPNLTYKDLKKFHTRFYQPHECVYYFYGNLPVEKHLDFLQKTILGKVKKKKGTPPKLMQKKLSKPIAKTLTYPVTELEPDKDIFGIGFLTVDILKQEDALLLQLLDLLIMGTDAAPLKAQILKSQLCKQAYSIFDLDNRQAPYVILFKDCKEKGVKKLESLLFKTLKSIKTKGFTQKQIEGAFHQLEFERLEITGGRYPFGLELYSRIGAIQHHGGDPVNGLKFKTLIDSLREKAHRKNFLTSFIDKFLINNKHRATLLFKPSDTLAQEDAEKEKELLKSMKQKLTAEETKNLVAQARALKRLQEQDESKEIEVLPKIKVSDVPKETVDYRLDHEKIGPIDHFNHPAFTNHIIYTDLVFEVPSLAQKDLPYLQLLATLLPEIGAANRNYKQNLEFIQQNTGGFDAALKLNIPVEGPLAYRPYFKLKSKALERNAPKLFSLLYDIATAPRFDDPDRIRDLLLQQYVFLENHIQSSPLKYALNLSSAPFSPYHAMRSRVFGLEYFHEVQKWLKNFNKEKNKIISNLQKLAKIIFTGGRVDLVTTCSPKMYETLVSKELFELTQLSNKKKKEWTKSPIPTPRKRKQVGKIIPNPVAFTAEAFSCPTYLDPASPSLSVLANIMDNTVLHKRIREQGGAYGSGALADIQSGIFYFYSYRDPHLVRTKAAFKESIETLAKGDFTKEHLDEAKLEWFQGADKPIPPGSRGLKAYVYLMENKSLKIRQAFRDKVRKAKKEELVQFAKKHLQPQMKNSLTVSFADKYLFKKENNKMKEAGLSRFVLEKV